MRGVLLALGGIACFAFGAAQAQQSGNTSSTTSPTSGGMGPGMGGGIGTGPHGMGGGMRAGPGDTVGWSLMTPGERREHRTKMMSFTRAKECRAYVEQHHRLMMERAKQRGVAIPATPAYDPCAGLKN